MRQEHTLTQENFAALLDWFSSDRDEAGIQYESVREGLIRYFGFRGCSDPDALADETITRVAMKVKTFDTNGNAQTISLFYGFAKNVFREYLATEKKRIVELDDDLRVSEPYVEEENEADSERFSCFDSCLGKLDVPTRDLLIRYYSKKKQEKFKLRRQIADELNLKKGTLHTRIHRLKVDLRKCMENCLKLEDL